MTVHISNWKQCFNAGVDYIGFTYGDPVSSDLESFCIKYNCIIERNKHELYDLFKDDQNEHSLWFNLGQSIGLIHGIMNGGGGRLLEVIVPTTIEFCEKLNLDHEFLEGFDFHDDENYRNILIKKIEKFMK